MQVFGVLEVPSHKYAGYDRQNSLASFFHPQQGSIFAISSPQKRSLIADLAIFDYH
jgi:hypothetical protein